MAEQQKKGALVAYCGLYCGACAKFKKGKCEGCFKNEKATWCKIRICNIENGYQSCADCTKYAEVNECKMFNNIFAKFFYLVFKSDREASIARIKESGYEYYAEEMEKLGKMVIERKSKKL